MNTSRKERRAYLKYLKKNDPAAYKEAKNQVQTIGKDLHRRHVADQLRKAEDSTSQTETKLNNE